MFLKSFHTWATSALPIHHVLHLPLPQEWQNTQHFIKLINKITVTSEGLAIYEHRSQGLESCSHVQTRVLTLGGKVLEA